MTTTTMNRAEAIETFVQNLSGDDLVTVLESINAYDGAFEDAEYYPMDEFDEFMTGKSPLAIARAVYFGNFNPTQDYFKFDAYANPVSADWGDVVSEAEDRIDDIIRHLTEDYNGSDTGFDILDDLVLAEPDALFDEDFEEIEPGDTPHIA